MLVEANVIFRAQGASCGTNQCFVISFCITDVMEIARYISEYGFVWGIR